MKKKSFFQIAVILMASFASWIYCIAVVVLGLIYQAYPGQEHIAVLISTLPTLVMMLSAFASSVLLRFCNRKYVVIISMLISIGAGLLILFLELPLAGVILCSALLGVPGGTIASANPTVLAEIAPPRLRDKVLGWHNSMMMLGMAIFTLLGGVFAKTGRFQDGYKTVLVLLPILILVLLFYPNVDREPTKDVLNADISAATPTAEPERFPRVAVGLLLVYGIGSIFWNAWYMTYSDYIVNEAQLGTSAMAGMIGSLCSVAGTVSGLVVAFWIRATKKFSISLAFILGGAAMLLPQLTQSAIGCYAGGILCQFFNLIIGSGLTTYLGLVTTGKNAATALSLLAGFEGSGVFLCGYIVPLVGNLFGGGAGTNILVSGIIMMGIGILTYFVIKPAHEAAYGNLKAGSRH